MTSRGWSLHFLEATLLSLMLAGCQCLFGSVDLAVAGTYIPCKLPVVVGGTVRPNVMIVQDMSGSMQFPVYYPFESIVSSDYSGSNIAYGNPLELVLQGATAYQIGSSNFGYWDPDTYYVYDTTNNWWKNSLDDTGTTYTPPVSKAQLTALSADGGGGGKIQFTAAGHGLSVGDTAVLYGLTSHTSMNGNPYTVTDVSGDTFKVVFKTGWTWDGKPDDASGYVTKRVNGSLPSVGLSGNIVDFLMSSRTDIALKALIGGRALVTDPNFAYLKSQGARRFVLDTTLGIAAHIRPGTATNPDAYNSGTYYGVTGSSTDPEKDMYLTISDLYGGKLTSADPKSVTATNSYTEVYTFTPSASGKLTIRMFESFAGASSSRVYLYSQAVPATNKLVATSSLDQDVATIYQQSVTAGTSYSIEATSSSRDTGSYWLMVTYAEGTGMTRGSDPNVPLTLNTATYPNEQHYANNIGRILNARRQVRIPLASRAGVVQNNFGLVRFGYTYFKGDSTSNYGKILVGCESTNLTTLLNAIQGVANTTTNNPTFTTTNPTYSGLDNTQCYPYYGTPTGEALWEVYDYFVQSSSHNYASNTTFCSTSTKHTIMDPWYDISGGALTAVPCRKSFVLLMSDGEWNGSVDPVIPAYSMRTGASSSGSSPTGDLRTDIANPAITTKTGTTTLPQTVSTFAVLTFAAGDTQGISAMKAITMYGGFTHVNSCGTVNSSSFWPYPETGYPSSSLTLFSSGYISKCDPTVPLPSGHSYNTTCCPEWDAIWDRLGDGSNLDKGVPDNYFEADNGQQLAASLATILQTVLVTDASASAVATVSQQLSDGDDVIRGVFEASDPNAISNYLWYGHLESYWPFPDPSSPGSMVYDFDLSCNVGLRCEQMPGTGCGGGTTAHCWDAAVFLDQLTPVGASTPPTGRNVLTYDPTGAYPNRVKPFNTTTITSTDLNVATSTAATNLINWTLGATVSGLRDRKGHRLADIVYSTPVVAGPPSVGAVSTNDPNIDELYTFRNQTLSPSGCPSGTCTHNGASEILYRDKVVYVGANDGMVHAFLLAKWDGTNHMWLDQRGPQVAGQRTHPDVGNEIWAYIPSNLLKEIQYLADPTYGCTGCQHRAMVDLSEKVAQVYINPNYPNSGARQWRTVLLGGERGGGDTYFAIDVTDPYNPIILWEYSVLKDRVVLYNGKAYQPFSSTYTSIEDFPMSWSSPAIGRLNLPATASFYTGAPDSYGNPTGAVTYSGTDANDNPNNYRAVAFIGGGIRLFDKAFATSPDPPSAFTSTQWSAFKADLFNPSFMAIDIETGQNLFKYVWPTLVQKANSGSSPVFPVRANSTNTIPYAMSDPVALDIWDDSSGGPGDDGFIDRVYVGDLNGNLYAIKFSSSFGIELDTWPTKTITDSTELSSDVYRSNHEPITVSASVSVEAPQAGTPPYLRVIFAAGKYEDVVGSSDDKSDLHKTSLYNLRDAATPPTKSSSATQVYSTKYYVQWQQNCLTSTFNTGCQWVNPTTGKPDCCESNCSSSCYSCVYDLTLPTGGGPAERFVGKPLIAGGYVWVTSFVPSSSPCDFTGNGYLYVFDYQCGQISGDTNPLPHTSLTVSSGGLAVAQLGNFSPGASYGALQMSLGTGMPSKPVLDSQGQNVVIQLSDGTLQRFPVDLGRSALQVQGGWQSSDK
jgi:hypothetical protein